MEEAFASFILVCLVVGFGLLFAFLLAYGLGMVDEAD